MTHLPDGQPASSVIPGDAGFELVAVGWLERGEVFGTGAVTAEFFGRLCDHVSNRWVPPFATAGFHACGLCQFGNAESSYGEHRYSSLSKGEVYIPDGSRIFVSPVSILHYVDCHFYQPPADFMEAVMSCPRQRSAAYLELLLASGGREWLRALKGE